MISINYRNSKSGRLLREYLRCPKGTSGDLVINWGQHYLSPQDKIVLNPGQAIEHSSNKIRSFILMKNYGVSIPQFYTNPSAARAALQSGERLVERRLVASSRGRGIRLLDGSYVNAPLSASLYTQFINSDYEVRVHVFLGSVIDYQQKKKRNGVNAHPYIRNHDNGWVFCRENVIRNDNAIDQAKAAVSALGLHFGAVDIAVKHDDAYVLEVNSTPGISGSTLINYGNKILSVRRSYGI